jgi:hypothetical protein
VIFTWTEILPAAIRSLSPLHQEIVGHVMEVPGKKRRSSAPARQAWNLDRDGFNRELGFALAALRLYLRRYGIASAADLDIR